MRPVVWYVWGNILNLGWAICVASYGFLFYFILFGGVLFVLRECCFHKSEKEGFGNGW